MRTTHSVSRWNNSEMTRQTEEGDLEEVGGVRATTDNDDFVQQIKADAEEAPTVEETIPEGGDE